jgi:hypothetical protein
LPIDLNNIPPRESALDLLNEAGAEGWEMVGISRNGIAYMKRPMNDAAEEVDGDQVARLPEADDTIRAVVDGERGVVRVKYRDPTSNETWSGRGRMASWLKEKQDAGEDIAKYLVPPTRRTR